MNLFERSFCCCLRVTQQCGSFRTRVMHGGDDLITYNMGNNKKEDYEQSEIQLHKMKPQEHYIEAQVQEGDTLQAIALRFYCSVSVYHLTYTRATQQNNIIR